MWGFDRRGWRSFLPVAKKLVAMLARLEKRRGCIVLDLDAAPHWLNRDLGFRDGRTTEEEMRRPPKWPDVDAR